MSTRRLSLIKENEIVLVQSYGNVEAIQVIGEEGEESVGWIKVKNVSSSEIVFMHGSRTTTPLTEEWVKKEVVKVTHVIKEKQNMLQKLTEINEKF